MDFQTGILDFANLIFQTRFFFPVHFKLENGKNQVQIDRGYVNSQNTVKPIQFFDKIKLILYPEARNSMT